MEQKSIRSLFVFNGFSSYVCLKDVDLNFIGTLQLKKFRKSGRFKVEEIFIVDSAHCLLTSYLFSVDEPKAKPSVSLHSEANLNTTVTMAIRPSEWTRKNMWNNLQIFYSYWSADQTLSKKCKSSFSSEQAFPKYGRKRETLRCFKL